MTWGHTLIAGQSNAGKSTFTKSRIKKYKRVIIFDVMGEYGGTGTGTKTLNWDTRNGQLSAARLSALLKPIWAHGFRVAVRPPSGDMARCLHQLSIYCVAAQAPYKAGADKTPLLLVVEEMNTAFPVESLPRECQGFAEVCYRGRHSGVATIGVTQRPQSVGAAFRDNVTEWVVFSLGSDLAIERVRKDLGKRVADEVVNLPRFKALRRTMEMPNGQFEVIGV